MGNRQEEKRELIRTREKIKKILNHMGLLLAVVGYTVLGALVRSFTLSSICGGTFDSGALMGKTLNIFGLEPFIVPITVPHSSPHHQVFQWLEHPAEISRFSELIQKVEDQRIKLIRFSSVCSQDVAKCNQLLEDYEFAIGEACRGGVSLPVKSQNEASSKWTFPEAAFFASTVLTTIGYGNTVPNTFWGRLFCILFAFVGIPLTLSVIADMGVIMASALSALHRKTKHYLPDTNWDSFGGTFGLRWLSALGGILLLVFYLSAGAALFMVWEEDWGFFEGFYFCFITMTTIGFGDLVPKSPYYMFVCTLYILVGLALTSTIIELVRRQYARSWKTIQGLTGPLADMLKRLGEGSVTGLDMTLIQNDLKKILTVVNLPKKSGNSQKEWEVAIESVIKDMKGKSPVRNRPTVLQIVVYETTV